jgi:phosphatidylethanolamine/phosphatidyl-N-methylethanolamine N-methyltransferase
MPTMTNRWRRFTYTLWAPVYDALAWIFHRQRARSLQLLNLQPGQRVLIVGAGTGLDLPLLPPGLHLTAIDLTPAMVRRLIRRAAHLQIPVDARPMDAHHLEFPDASFDAVILHLILAVVPDPILCIREVQRVLRPGGRAVVFDKFVPEGAHPSILRRLFNPGVQVLFTDMTRQLGVIVQAAPTLRITHDQPVGLTGFFRIALLYKQDESRDSVTWPPGAQPH